MEEKQTHLPIFGVGPLIWGPMIVLTVLGTVLSALGVIPFAFTHIVWKIVFLAIGVLLIGAGIACIIAANLPSLFSHIRKNELKTDGAYAFVRNPCYAFFLLVCTGILFLAHNPVLLVLPLFYWLEMTLVLIHTEEKWLEKLYGEQYLTYKKSVNRCIPWFPKKK